MYSLPKSVYAKDYESVRKMQIRGTFFKLNFSPTIYPPIICLKRLFSATCQKKEIPDNV